MNPVRKTAAAGGGHIAAIHILKAQLQMSDADYRVLLDSLTTQSSCKDMTDKQLQVVRSHMHKLAVSMGAAKGSSSATGYNRKSFTKSKVLFPMEKKVWAIWYALEAKGLVQVPPNTKARAKALRAYVERQTGASDMAFLEGDKLVKLVESMKKWLERGGHEVMDKVTETAK
jgi:phage gp16-like protein